MTKRSLKKKRSEELYWEEWLDQQEFAELDKNGNINTDYETWKRWRRIRCEF